MKQHLLSLAPSSPLGWVFCKSGKGALTLHACHQASAFKSRFNAREKEIHFYPLYWESIQRVMANLLDCHGNRWEKWFSLCLCVCLFMLKRLYCTPLRVYHRSHCCITMCTELAPFKNRFLRHLTYILYVLTSHYALTYLLHSFNLPFSSQTW